MIELVDIQSGFMGTTKGEAFVVKKESCIDEMNKCRIAKSLVRIVPGDLEHDILASNQKLYEHCLKTDRLIPCPILLPNTGLDIGDEKEQIEKALANGAGAAWLRFSTDYWIRANWVDEKLFCLLGEYRLPAFIQAHSLGLEKVAELAKQFPDLAIIYADIGYREQRLFIPLLQNRKNIYLSLAGRYTVHFGIEQLVGAVGHQHLLFGTGFPQSEPMSAIMQLMYADIPQSAKQQIGSQNFYTLYKRIKS